jgi:hypothetical protein
LKHEHYVVIGGAALFVIGIGVVVAWVLPTAEQLGKDKAFMQRDQLNAGKTE